MSEKRRKQAAKQDSKQAAKQDAADKTAAHKNGAEQAGKGQSKRPKVDPVEFWGDPALLPEPPDRIEPADDITALVASLGRIPIAGRQTAAEHWLKLVYERAGVLAGVLAAAGGLDADAAEEAAAGEHS